MPTIEELKARRQAAATRRETAKLTTEETETAELLAAIEEDTSAARVDEKRRRAIAGDAAEAVARKAAAGKYLVRFADLAGLLPDADPEQLPGSGVLVLRSPPVDALSTFQREVEAADRDLQNVYLNLLMESVVQPDVSDDAVGAKVRAFFESDLGCGTVVTLGDAAAQLGGARAKKTKRGRE